MGGFTGQGVGATSSAQYNQGSGSGSYSMGSSGGYGGGSSNTTSSAGGVKTYTPYSADADKPPQAISSSGGFGGGMKWGPDTGASGNSQTSNIGGSTFNITNNNHINYNYGSNITAIYSEGSVPTF